MHEFTYRMAQVSGLIYGGIMATSMLGSSRTRRANPLKAPFRPDIQGLRAVAVLLVLVYHAGFQPLIGGFVGVDVFFVISGFLITGGLLREYASSRKISLAGFYGRRAARILPAATVAIISVIGLTVLLLPKTRWVPIGQDALASSFYVMNWLLAGGSVDYLAQDQAPSPLQHYWSLSVEEQFYLVWPILLIAVMALAKKFGWSKRAWVGAAFLLIAVPSLAWSIYLTATAPGPAYFVTPTRMWELAIGAGLAIFPFRAVPKVAAAVVGWLGFAAVVGSALIYTTATPFPGAAALLPTLGAAAIIWAGPVAGKLGPAVVLGVKPMVWVGAISYSLYLWHWPLLVIAGALLGTLGVPISLTVAAISFVPAWLSYRYIETPVLNWSKRDYAGEYRTAKITFLASLATAVAAMMVILVIPPTPQVEPNQAVAIVKPKASDVAAAPARGAELLFANPSMNLAVDSFPSITPTAVNAAKDLPQNACQQDYDSTDVQGCLVKGGDTGPNIALVGDSHAAMYSPGLADAVANAGGQLTTYTKGSCPFSAATVIRDNNPYPSCTEWVSKVTAKLLADKPDAVYVGTARYIVAGFGTVDDSAARDRMAAGLAQAWKPLIDAGIPVIAIRDAPRADTPIPDCVAKNPTTLTACQFPKQGALMDNPIEMRAVAMAPGSTLLDLTPAICPGDTCPVVMDGLLMWRDGNHLTATFAKTLDKFFAKSLPAKKG